MTTEASACRLVDGDQVVRRFGSVIGLRPERAEESRPDGGGSKRTGEMGLADAPDALGGECRTPSALR